MAIINGTNGDNFENSLFGTNDDDQIFGFDGNDFLFGSPGNDLMDAGDGPDVIIYDVGTFTNGVFINNTDTAIGAVLVYVFRDPILGWRFWPLPPTNAGSGPTRWSVSKAFTARTSMTRSMSVGLAAATRLTARVTILSSHPRIRMHSTITISSPGAATTLWSVKTVTITFGAVAATTFFTAMTELTRSTEKTAG